MRFLLDTNAASEPQRPRSDHGYMQWVGAQASTDLAVSSLTFGELSRGVSSLAPGRRRAVLSEWLITWVTLFSDRIVPVDLRVAQTWGELANRLKQEGCVIGAVDELIAATALTHGLVLVTRNTRHFEATGCELLSPWSS